MEDFTERDHFRLRVLTPGSEEHTPKTEWESFESHFFVQSFCSQLVINLIRCGKREKKEAYSDFTDFSARTTTEDLNP